MNCDEGTAWTAVAHIITGVIGSGVLSLAWSMAQLGWIAGPVTMLCFALVTLVSAFLLCDCYRSPDPEFGPKRNRSYLEAVHETLGRYKNILLVLMSSSFFLILIIFSNHSYN
jgi:amino acid permease